MTALLAEPALAPSTGPAPESPPEDRAGRQRAVVAALRPLLPAHALLWNTEDTVPYECDGLTAYRQKPLVVALPGKPQGAVECLGFVLGAIPHAVKLAQRVPTSC